MRGIFITFEGIEGSGKTTLMELVARSLGRNGRNCVLTREPGGTPLGLSLRRVLLDPSAAQISSTAELMLFAADRAQHVAEVIRPALDHDSIVLCDRFSDATVAYQGYGRGLPLEVIASVDSQARGETAPDLTVLLDLTVGEGLGRARSRNEGSCGPSESRIDEEETAFHQRVRDGYLDLAREEPDRFLVLDATLEPGNLAEMVTDELARRFPRAF
ncbi:MAG: dTMP kinase [bacterium]|nr:dTMP kinase [bacterium]MDT8396496.1 dTMP kinase [bacterium]